MKSTVANYTTNCAAHVVAHVGHVGQVTDAVAATVAAVVGRVECCGRGLRRRVGAGGGGQGAYAAVVNTGVLRTLRNGGGGGYFEFLRFYLAIQREYGHLFAADQTSLTFL